MAKTAFIGLGVMGYPMAGHLAKEGHDVTVYNRTAKKAEDWVKEHGGSHAATPAKAAQGAEIVFACVGNDDDLRSVVYGDDGILTGMDKPVCVLSQESMVQDVVNMTALSVLEASEGVI